MIYDEGESTVPTIEKALTLVGREGNSYENLRVKGLGLRLALMGLAEVQALRMSRLAGMVYQLETALLDPNTIRELEPKQLMSLYQTSVRALQETSGYVDQVLKGMNWKDLETELLAVAAQSNDQSGDTANLEKISDELLTTLARAQAQMALEKGEDGTETTEQSE